MSSLEQSLRIGVYARQMECGNYDSADKCRDSENIKSIEDYAAMINEAAAKAHEAGCDILVLPGHSLGRDERLWSAIGNENLIAKGINVLQSIANKYNLMILGEVDHTYWFYPDGIISSGMEQRFVRSNDNIILKDQFLQDFSSPVRTITLKNRTAKVMLCGENNILKVPHTKDKSEPVLEDDKAWPSDYDVIINPTHSSAIRPELWTRYAHWSKNGKTVIHTTNNVHKNWTKTAIRVYQNGEESASAIKAPQLIIGINWRMVIVNTEPRSN